MRLRLAVASLILSLPAFAEDAALDVYDKAVKAMNATEGYHIESQIDVDMGGSSMPGGSVEGVIRNPELSHFKIDLAGNALEIYKEKEHVAMLNPQTGKWEGQSANQTLDFFIRIFNMGTLLGQLRESVDSAKFGAPEEVGKRDCRTIEFEVPKKALKALIDGKGQASLGVTPENTNMKVKAWIDRKEGLPRKIAIVIDVELKGLPGAPDEEFEDWDEEDKKDGDKPDHKKGDDKKDDDEPDAEDEVPPMKVAITVTASIKKYGTELEIEVPEAVRKVLDAQNVEPTEPRKDDNK